MNVKILSLCAAAYKESLIKDDALVKSSSSLPELIYRYLS